jgi:mannose-6-phosphate isomerase class I
VLLGGNAPTHTVGDAEIGEEHGFKVISLSNVKLIDIDILTKSVLDSYDACMLHVRHMHAYLALDCWEVHSDEYTSATSCTYTSQPLL